MIFFVSENIKKGYNASIFQDRNRLRLACFQFDKYIDLTENINFILCPIDVRERIECIHMYTPRAKNHCRYRINLYSDNYNGYSQEIVISDQTDFLPENSILFDGGGNPEALKTIFNIDKRSQYWLGVEFYDAWKRKGTAYFGKSIKFIISSIMRNVK